MVRRYSALSLCKQRPDGLDEPNFPQDFHSPGQGVPQGLPPRGRKCPNTKYLGEV